MSGPGRKGSRDRGRMAGQREDWPGLDRPGRDLSDVQGGMPYVGKIEVWVDKIPDFYLI